ncbi:MAG: hypothetical protein K8S98_17115 [Planctomycetes bacterium]|nr:hypothetical protein [Planctomycetota bacterium]
MASSFLAAIAGRACRTVLSVGAALALFALPSSAQVRISQLWPNTPSSGTVPNAAYVELFNAGASSVDLTTYSLHYTSSAGTSWTRLGLTGSVPARGYYLVRMQNPSTTSTALPLPLPDQTAATILMSTTTGKLGLIQGASVSAATGQCCVPPAGSVLVDFVGYGTSADAREAGGAPCAPAGTSANNTPAPTTLLAVVRTGCGANDTNFNNVDFVAGTPNPRNSTCTSNALSGSASNISAATGATPTITATASVCAGGTISGSATATINLSTVGGSAAQSMGAPVGNVFTLNTFVIPAGTNPGMYNLPVSIVDGANSANLVAILNVTSVAAPLNNVAGANVAQFTFPGSGGLQTSTITNATLDVGSSSCAGGFGPDTYHYFTPSTTGNWTISSCMTSVNQDLIVSVHTGTPATTANLVVPTTNSCKDDGCPGTTSFNLATATVALTAGTPYVIRVQHFSSTSTNWKPYHLRVSGQAPSNDTCATAVALTLGGAPIAGTTILATTDGTSSCDASGRDVWYKVTTPSTGDISVTTCGSAIDTAVAIYATCGGAQVACNDDCGGAPCGGPSSCLTATAQPAGTYLIRVSDKGIGSGGAFSIAASFVGPTPPSGVGAITPSTVQGGATVTMTVTVTPGTNPTSSGITVTANMTSLGGSSTTSLFDDGIAPDVTANDNVFTVNQVVSSCLTDGLKTIAFTILDAQARSANGSATVTTGYCSSTATGFVCGTDEFISNTKIGTINNTTACVAVPGYEDFHCTQSTNVAQGSSALITVTIGTWFSSDLVTVYSDWNHNGVFTDSGESTVLSNGGTAIYTGTLNVPFGAALGNTRMRVRLNFSTAPTPCGSTSFGNIEDYTLVVGPPAAPGNDLCSGALPATCGGSVTSDTTLATVDTAPACGPVLTAPGVWYSVTGTGFAMTATTCDPGTTYDTRLSVFSGTCGSLVCVGDNDDDGVCVSPDRSTVSWSSTAGVTYYLLVSGNGSAVGTAKLTLTCPNYCASTSTDITFEKIGRVEFGTIDNTPALTANDKYTLYPLSTAVARCGTYPIKVTVPGSYMVDRCTVWVDWNQNLTLNDSGEVYQLNGGLGPVDSLGVPTTTNSVTGYFNGTISVPFGASLGNARVRVGMGDTSVTAAFSQTNPCVTFTYGEVEDYGISVSTGGTTFYADVDGDGFGDPNGATVVGCTAPPGYVANSGDLCPNDSGKANPGQCGCGIADTDTDADGTADCNDLCPTDPNKIAPGTCGCGTADTDTDSDGTPDCNDLCPADPNKIAPGTCGCGFADTDSDSDGTPDCNDACANDPFKIAPGACGCGIADTDSDSDGTPDCNDGCASDPNKITPGQCGCGVPDTDSDSDGTADCNDLCPADPNKIAPGQCGCGFADTDTDNDGTADCNDLCPTDPNKIAPGTCGCGFIDSNADTDGDGTIDCSDACPTDPNKIAPGICGCGVADVDTDSDGTFDCFDGCVSDPNKIAPGQCGCGFADTDTDSDGTADCNDLCANDPNKIAPGQCGCGFADTDSDNDGTADCNDLCPTDSNKIAPGQCGCGFTDTDTDNDGTADCVDGCPNDANKVAPGQCGCGTADTDTDTDGIADCNDNCDTIANPGQQDCNGNGVGDACDLVSNFSLDTNSNTIPDDCEQGVGTPFCFGDGSQTPCPCGNSGGTGEGCANSTGNGALLYNLGGASVGAGNTTLYVVRMPVNKFGLVYMGSSDAQIGGAGLPFKDGLRCVKGFIKRFGAQSSGATGSFVRTNPAAAAPALIVAGSTWYFQVWHRDVLASPCGTSQNLSNGLKVDFLP